MSLPTDINLMHFYYLIGNTPAVSLTRHLPPELDARILLLGSGDLRNILFTCYADGAPERALDITLCDYEPGVVARNILLLSLINDGVPNSTLWDIYYHFRITPQALQTIHTHVKKLSNLAISMDTWKSGPLSAVIEIPAVSTLVTLQRLWSRWAGECASARCDGQARLEKAICKATQGGRRGLSGMALSPLSPCVIGGDSSILFKEHVHYWAHGTTNLTQNSPASGDPCCLNPTFIANDGFTFAHYGSDPIIGFHLSTACTAITKNSVLNGGATFADAAKKEFEAWLDAFKPRLQRKNIAFRFVISDALAFCRLLQSRARHLDYRLACFVDHWHFEHLSLNDKCFIPETFNVIDTSNLIDHLGGVNMLVATASLLDVSASAALYTELLLSRSSNGLEVINKAMHGDVGAIALLFGLLPVEHYTNCAVSSSAELAALWKFMSSDKAKSLDSRSQTQLRMTWRRTPVYSGPPSSPQFKMAPREFAGAMYSIYKQMFSYENPMQLMASMALGKGIDVLPRSFTREAWVACVAAVKANVDTDWGPAMDRLHELILADKTSPLTPNGIQDLYVYMHLHGLFTSDVMKVSPSDLASSPFALDASLDIKSALPELTSMPPVVCITMKVPRVKLAVFTGKNPDELGTPSIKCHTEANQSAFATNSWQNIHSLVQAGFGEIEGCHPGVTNDKVRVTCDGDGWSGSAPMVVSFLSPTWVLLKAPGTVRIKLSLSSTPQTASVFTHDLGLELAVYYTTLADKENIYITKDWPNWKDGTNAAPAPKQNVSSPTAGSEQLSYTTTVKTTPSHDKIGSIVSRVNIGPGKYRDALQAKAAVSVKALAPAQVEVGIGTTKPPILVQFPGPINTSNLTTRVARKSFYVEVEAPAAKPENWVNHPDYIFPVLPPTTMHKGQPLALNMPRCHLPPLPTIDFTNPTKGKFEWLNPHLSASFSAKESVVKKAQAIMKPGANMPRYDLKDSFYSLFIRYSGLQGPRMCIFGLGDSSGAGVEMVIFISAMRLDLSAQSVVIDAAVIPLRVAAMQRMAPFLGAIQGSGSLCQVNVKADEMQLWKAALPATVERCRTWKHKDACEYAKVGQVPVTKNFGERLFCSCGEGVFPQSYDGGKFPEWDLAKKYATRAAIPVPFSFPTVEKPMGTD